MLNTVQEEIIQNLKTPAIVIAGPGCGKTYTIVKTIANLIKKGHDPKKLFISSFTSKSSKELEERLYDEFEKESIEIDTSDILVGTFHSLCLKLTERYFYLLDDRNDYKLIDEKIEGYLIEKNAEYFKNIEGFSPYYNFSKKVMRNSEEIDNNLIDLESLDNPSSNFDLKTRDEMKILANLYRAHKRLLKDNNLINYTTVLKRFYEMLQDDYKRDIISNDIDFVIIDEYQDTNYIQQEILFKLLKDNNSNILVVGDDDQSLYRFRSADPYNFIHFDKITKEKRNKSANKYLLDINYRSNQNIIDFCDKWINLEENLREGYRYDKNIKSNKLDNNEAISLIESKNTDNLVKYIRELHKVINLNQIAFLFPSLKTRFAKNLQKELEKNGIPVFNKKGNAFFEREEIRALMYAYLKIFSLKPKLAMNYPIDKESKDKEKFKSYLYNVWEDSRLNSDKDLNYFLKNTKQRLDNNEKIYLNEINYKLFYFKEFEDILKRKLTNLKDIRAQNNISIFLNLIKEYADVNDIKVIDREKSIYLSRDFLYGFIFYIFKNNLIEEYSLIDIPPKNSVNFLTIHQAKGLEFSICFITNDGEFSPKTRIEIYDYFKKYDKGNIYNEKCNIEKMDMYRKYYTAFSRAKDYLLIFDNSYKYNLRNIVEKAYRYPSIDSNILKREKINLLKNKISYTADIELYEKCPLRYKFMRKLKFDTIKSKSLDYGTKVHRLVEYINNLYKNYGKIDLDILNEIEDIRVKEAINNYIKKEIYKNVKSSETTVKKDYNEYILMGNIDIILKDNTIIDIKTGKINKEHIKSYQNQLNFYHKLLEENQITNDKLKLYYIDEDQFVDVNINDIETKEIAQNIVKGNIYEKTKDTDICKMCPMKYFCKRF